MDVPPSNLSRHFEVEVYFCGPPLSCSTRCKEKRNCGDDGNLDIGHKNLRVTSIRARDVHLQSHAHAQALHTSFVDQLVCFV